MASEFDEALVGFLAAHEGRLQLTIQLDPRLRGGLLVEVTDPDGYAIGSGTSRSLDHAINDAVEGMPADAHTMQSQEFGAQLSEHTPGEFPFDPETEIEPNAEQCPCESEACERLGLHRAGECPHQADPKLRVEYLGALCPACYERMPPEYRLEGD